MRKILFQFSPQLIKKKRLINIELLKNKDHLEKEKTETKKGAKEKEWI